MGRPKKNKTEDAVVAKEKTKKATPSKEKTKEKSVRKKNKVNDSEIVEKKSTAINNVVLENNSNEGISPEVEEEKEVEEGEPLNIDLPFDDQTIFIINRGATFCEGQFLNPHNAVKIKRINEANFHMTGTNEKGQPFGQPIQAEKEWCDWLYAELVDYQKNPAKYTIEMAPLPSASNQNPNVQPAIQYEDSKPVNNTVNNQINPIITPESITTETSNEVKKTETKIDGVQITKQNINEIMNQAPNFTQPATVQHNMSMATSFNVDELVKNQSIDQMVEYGRSISNHINESFQARIQGGYPIGDAQKLLDISSKDYTYELVTDNIGTFLKIKKGQLEVRVPSDTNDYLKVK